MSSTAIGTAQRDPYDPRPRLGDANPGNCGGGGDDDDGSDDDTATNSNSGRRHHTLSTNYDDGGGGTANGDGDGGDTGIPPVRPSVLGLRAQHRPL